MTDPDKKLQLEMDYASGWFQNAASQRLTTFNFFLVVVGLLVVAYAQAIEHQWTLFGACIGFIGAAASLGFLIIDLRNEVLVNKGLSALRTLEAQLQISLADAALDRKHLRQLLEESCIGRVAVRCIYGSLKSRCRRSGSRCRRSGSRRGEQLFKYRFWFRAIISMVGAGFLIGCVCAILGFFTATHPSTVTCRSSTVLSMHRPGYDLSLVKRSESEGEQRGSNDDRGRPDHGLRGDLHVQSVGMGDHKRVETGRHCGKQAIGGG
jgi:hypothetical protein